MKGRVIRYTRSTLLISVLHSQIVWRVSAYNWTSFLEEFWIEIIDKDFEISDVNE